MAYLTLAEYRLRSRIPGSYIDDLEVAYAGYVDAMVAQVSAAIDARLAKRYAVPFDAPAPIAVQAWVTQIVDLQVWLKRGFDGTTLDGEQYVRASQQAYDEVREAADAKDGLYDLPLRSDTTASGIARTAIRWQSNASPYVARSKVAQRGRTEDSSGEPSSGR